MNGQGTSMNKPMRGKKTTFKPACALLGRIYASCLLGALSLLPCLALAEEDNPFTRTGNAFYGILFGVLGTTLCAIIMGATFLLAKFGKVSWDKFLYIGFCVAGFLGTPSIIALIKSTVGQGQ